jgi:hypothetical protein
LVSPQASISSSAYSIPCRELLSGHSPQQLDGLLDVCRVVILEGRPVLNSVGVFRDFQWTPADLVSQVAPSSRVTAACGIGAARRVGDAYVPAKIVALSNTAAHAQIVVVTLCLKGRDPG